MLLLLLLGLLGLLLLLGLGLLLGTATLALITNRGAMYTCLAPSRAVVAFNGVVATVSSSSWPLAQRLLAAVAFLDNVKGLFSALYSLLFGGGKDNIKGPSSELYVF